jgi:DNA-binding SARP family transcriptional activator
MPPSLEIRVLGELELLRGGKPLSLPASKKTRALLGYLVVVGARPQPRQRLCELFWDGPDDPRAGLRWSLTKVRPLVDDASVTRLVADREHVVFEAHGAAVDLDAVESLGPLTRASLDALRGAAARYRGELLEGLDLPGCYRYHEWCIAERERTRRLRGGILATLVERLGDSPEEALSHARARVAIDPLAEPAHIAVMQLLAKLGRPREAIRQYEGCRRVLEAQLGRTPSKELEVARASLGQVQTASPPETSVHAVVPAEARARLVGRSAESAAIAAALHDAANAAWRQVLLFAGEPGIGKTRLLGEVADQAIALGGVALAGRAFEAEMVRPYGPWIDVLRSVPRDAIDGSARSDLAPLLPELGAAHGEADRNRLFAAVGKLLQHRSAHAPLVVALDDVQWFDEASVALLHYLSRFLVGSRVVLACAARAAEIDGNPRVGGLLRALVREGRLMRIDLTPLDEEGVTELVRSVDGNADAAKILSDGGGNPFFSIELARAAAHGDPGGPMPTLDGLISERLARLDPRAAELVPWAAALGHAFSVDALAAITSLPVCDLLAALEELERHGVLRVNGSAPSGAGYDFAHDLVRRMAYRTMSEPRRRWVHLHIARALDAVSDAEGALAGDIAHHAALGGDSQLAARAYVVAGERCLRLLALADASRLAASGIQHAARLAPEASIRLRLALLSVQVHSNQWLKRSHELEAELRRVADLAEQREMHAEATRAYYLISFVHNERGDFARASAFSLEAAEAGRAADVATRQHQLANTGRCLALIERDVARAEKFLREAESLGRGFGGPTRLEMTFGEGLVRAFKGLDTEAILLLERAAELAATEADPWSQSQALIRIARVALEHGRPRETVERCAALDPLVAKLSGGSERPFADALRALALLATGEVGALAAAEQALHVLRGVDSQVHVAYVLNALAAHDACAGRADHAERRAREALRAAEIVGHKSEAAVARSRLATLAIDRRDRREAEELLETCVRDMRSPLSLSGRARAAVMAVSARLGGRSLARRPTG